MGDLWHSTAELKIPLSRVSPPPVPHPLQVLHHHPPPKPHLNFPHSQDHPSPANKQSPKTSLGSTPEKPKSCPATAESSHPTSNLFVATVFTLHKKKSIPSPTTSFQHLPVPNHRNHTTRSRLPSNHTIPLPSFNQRTASALETL
nr:uncharacterized protein LOC129163614 [Nothobranchius furzeri]